MSTRQNISIPKKILTFLVSIAFCVLVVSGISYGGNIIVKPGKFDHFSIQMPEKVKAGEGFMVRLFTYDAHDNLITDFGETGKDFKVSVSGAATVQPSILKATSFTGGSTGITIMDKKMETIILSIYEVNGTVPVLTKEIVVSPNKLDHFSIQSPQSATAGNNFDIKVIAKDAFDNQIIDNEVEAKNIKITSTGTTGFKIVNTIAIFRDGVGVATLMAEKTGEAAVEVYDTVTGSKGTSANLKILPSTLSQFKLSAPKEATAGEPFEVTIIALDTFDNLIENYASYGGGVNIVSTGQTKLTPSFVGQSEFRNGQAVIKLRYEKAEEITVVAVESNKNQQGKSTPVRINPSAPDSFTVTTPDSAIAGQRFKIKVEAYDRFNNLVKNYNLIGNDVYLNASGTGVLSPKIISASEFVNGIASIDVLYDKAESFTISASMTTKREEKKIAVKEYKEEVKVKELEKPKIEKPEKRIAAKEEKKVEVKEVKKAEKKEEIKEEKVEVKKVEKKAMDKPFEINEVSLIEAKNKAMVIFKMKSPDGNLEIKDERESVKERDIIKLILNPASNKTKKQWKFKSAFVKEVRLEQDRKKAGVLNIKIETLSKQFTYDVNRVQDSLVISITTP
jgi:hypothetical protein